MGVTLVIFLSLIFIFDSPFSDKWKFSGPVLLVVGGATLSLTGWSFLRWLWCWLSLKRFVFCLACLMTLIALICAEENWRAKRNWEAFRHEWEAKGEKFDCKDFIPPPVPDDQNFALTPVVASCYSASLDKNGNATPRCKTNVVNQLDFSFSSDRFIDRKLRLSLGDWRNATVTDLQAYQTHYRNVSTNSAAKSKPDNDQSSFNPPSAAAEVLSALSKYDSTVEALRQASLLPQCRFPLNYSTDFSANISLEHLSAMRNSVTFLQLRTAAELKNNETDKALADVKLMLRLSEKIRPEPFLSSYIWGIWWFRIVLQPVYEGLAEHRWSESQIMAIDDELAKVDFLEEYQIHMRGELGRRCRDFEYLRNNPEQVEYYLLTEFRESFKGVLTHLALEIIPNAVLYQNQLCYARSALKSSTLIDLKQRMVSPLFFRNYADAFYQQDTKTITPYNVLNKQSSSWLCFNSWVNAFAENQTYVDLARTAIALERYRLAHGKFPASLDALSPQFIARAPHDVINGKPLKYRREPDGQFVLYSVGWNEKDDGGKVVFVKLIDGQILDTFQGDWVWRYPKGQ